jgi:Protein of unknown function (DUF3572)
MPLRNSPKSSVEPATLALQALGYILANEALRDRFMALSGLEPDDLRHRLNEDAVLGAILHFLSGHEPDLIACAQYLCIAPEQLMQAAHLLQPQYD